MRSLPAFRLLFLFACVASALGAETLAFRALGENEEIKIQFHSSGCFHSITQRFLVRGGVSKQVLVFAVREKWDEEKKQTLQTGVDELGVLSLSARDLSQLDRLIGFYRQPQTGGCTTVDRIQVEYYRAGQKIGAEDFTDGTCATYDMKTVLTLPELAARLEKKPEAAPAAP